jgi:hypothetical protein
MHEGVRNKFSRRICSHSFAAIALVSGAMAETRLTIATVNNGDMIRMQKLTLGSSRC